MSNRNGHRSRADVARKKKQIQRMRTDALRKELAAQTASATSSPEQASPTIAPKE